MLLTVRCAFLADVGVAGTARLAAAELLRTVRADEEFVAEVMLVVSELVTNAVVHAGSVIDLEISVCDEEVRIEVGDRDPSRPARRESSGETVGGHGLNLVNLSSRDWGVRDRADAMPGKTVWAVLRRTGDHAS